MKTSINHVNISNILKSFILSAIGIDPVLISISILTPIIRILLLLRSLHWILRLLLIDQNLNKLGRELVIGIQSS